MTNSAVMERPIIIKNSHLSNVLIDVTGQNIGVNDSQTISRLLSIIEQQNEQINHLLQIICMQRICQTDNGNRQLTNDLPEM